ncbi:MAG: single-stranded DNA-binding protein [Parahaliea sp.]
MQQNTFTGRFAADPEAKGESAAQFTLISNEYAGKDDAGEAKERAVSIRFVAFKHIAKFIAEYGQKGAKATVFYRIENNHYDDQDGNTHYGYNFIVQDADLA